MRLGDLPQLSQATRNGQPGLSNRTSVGQPAVHTPKDNVTHVAGAEGGLSQPLASSSPPHCSSPKVNSLFQSQSSASGSKISAPASRHHLKLTASKNTANPPSPKVASSSSSSLAASALHAHTSDPFAAISTSHSNAAQQLDYFVGNHVRKYSPALMSPQTPARSSHSADVHPWAQLFGSDDMPTAVPLGLDVTSNLSLPLLGKQASAKQPSAPSQAASSPACSSRAQTQAQSRPIGASLSLPIPRAKNLVAPSDDPSRYCSIECSELVKLLRDQDQSSARNQILVIDIRPSSFFESQRIKGSINICAPSTLLRRPGVTIYDIEGGMLRSDHERDKFLRWKKGPLKPTSGGSDEQVRAVGSGGGLDRVVVLDTETTRVDEAGRPAVGGGGPCLVGMLRKFDSVGFAGHLNWLVGGFVKFVEHAAGNEDLVESGPVADFEPATKQSNGSLSVLLGQQQGAVQQNQLISDGGPSPALGRQDQGQQSPARRCGMHLGGLPLDAFTDNSTTNCSLSQQGAIKPQVGDVGSEDKSSTATCNPFFDNIRQNRELQYGITERIPLELPDLSGPPQSVLPDFIVRLAAMDTTQRAEFLAQNFFEVEKAEQARLMATMRQHAAESTHDPRTASEVTGRTQLTCFHPDRGSRNGATRPSAARESNSSAADEETLQLSSPYCRISDSIASKSLSSSFPFSIAAAIEKGRENRYNNIWTYEHSRVKLDGACKMGSDYLNGSYVEPMKEFGCYRQYIATQAPLPATFDAFWAAVWQENSFTIAMLTREYESGRVQSHNYWDGKQYGPNITVEVLEVEELDGLGQPVRWHNGTQGTRAGSSGSGEGEFLADVSAAEGLIASSRGNVVIIRRKILLINSEAVDEGPRQINHLQYVGWPDYSIPEDPKALLIFADMASQSQQEAHLRNRDRSEVSTDSTRQAAVGPLLLHCSAGVGRTGTYIVIDTVLDVLRRERRRNNGLPPLDLWDNGPAMDSEAFVCSHHDAISPTEDVEMAGLDMGRKPLASASAPEVASPQLKEKVSSSPNSSVAWPPPLDLDETTIFAGIEASLRGQRRSLKRELSPSASMDVDQRSGGLGLGESGSEVTPSTGNWRGSIASLPVVRNRSFSSDNPQQHTSEDEGGSADSVGSVQTSLQCGWGNLGISELDGMDTPSRALNSMSLGLGKSNSTSSTTLSHPATPALCTTSQRYRAGVRQRRPNAVGASANHSDEAGAKGSGGRSGLGNGSGIDSTDLVRHATNVAREQRMSSVQTQRQYVFCYLAVAHGVLREVKREGVASK